MLAFCAAWLAGLALVAVAEGGALADVPAGSHRDVRAQVDTVGFANTAADMAALLEAVGAKESAAVAARRAELGLAEDQPWVAAIMPHDDYLYAAPVDLHLLPGMRAERWIVIGVCHACRRIGVSGKLLFDGHDTWRVAGDEIPVDHELRARLLEDLPEGLAVVDDVRHDAEHSIESLLPWLRAANPDARFVPVLAPGFPWHDLSAAADRFGLALARICRDQDWRPGVDIGILISADAVHYGCEGWGPSGGHHPYGCDEAGHAAAVARDVTLAEVALTGPLTPDGPERFVRAVWRPGDPRAPYRITWCGIYSIPFGLTATAAWVREMGTEPLAGHLLRYGDSVTDGRLEVPGTALGVTAPNTLAHWVGYPGLGYVAQGEGAP